MLLEKLFQLKESDTTVRRELVAGLTNFMTISYIIFVQPSLLSLSGMDYGAVMVATCISSAIATFFMAFLTNYPVVLAPGMGLKFGQVQNLIRKQRKRSGQSSVAKGRYRLLEGCL